MTARAPDGAPSTLARLARALAEIPGLDRIRYTTSHPRDMDDDLIAAHGELDALMPYLHLPVQSGSDRILRAMNRKHTAPKAIVDLIGQHPRRAARHRPLRRLHRRLPRRDRRGTSRTRWIWCARSATPRPSRSSIRRRPGTPAAAMPGQVADEVGARAAARAAGPAATNSSRAFNAAQAGRIAAGAVRKAGPPRRARPSAARPICRRSTSRARIS